MSYPEQVIISLPVDAAVNHDELIRQLPMEPISSRHFFCLNKFDQPLAPQRDSESAQLDWLGLGAALQRLVLTLPRTTAERAIEYHIAGLAPLPLFVMLGAELAFQGPQVVYNRDKDGVWQQLAVNKPGTSAGDGPAFFDVRPDPRHSEAIGWVALCISLSGGPVARTPVREALRSELAGIEELSVVEHRRLTSEAAPRAARDIRVAVSGLRNSYPHAQGIALFIDGPSQLAYLVGHEINPKVFPRVRVYYHHPTGHEEAAFELPWRVPEQQRIGQEASDRLTRLEVFKELIAGLRLLQGSLEESDIVGCHPQPADFLRRFRELQVKDIPIGDDFDLDTISGVLMVPEGLLEACRHLSDRARFAHLLVLHELLHDDQRLYHSNYRGIGRAGVVLEDVDYRADAFSLEVAVRWALRCGAQHGAARVPDEATAYIRAALCGMQVFDQMEQGRVLLRLAERRLRRYLNWHLQLQRARGLRGEADVAELFRSRVVVEIAPLRGYLDHRHDKFIQAVVPGQSRLFAACDGLLFQASGAPVLDMSALLSAVRCFDQDAIQDAMRHLVEQNRKQLTPWLARGREF